MAMMTVDVRDLPGRLQELLALAAQGTQVVVADGMTAATLGPAPKTRPIIFDMHPGAMTMREDFDDPIDDEDFLKGNI